MREGIGKGVKEMNGVEREVVMEMMEEGDEMVRDVKDVWGKVGGDLGML